ncbi:MAG TPA: hypothetical protein VM934_15665 [Pyrinomonadaceae bacterium]|jgi:DMSO/TMAO reductase YedYZ molybdopterin-dependent catalytic subunit|nr:hypothetical protein [Pyrinomonadaceae bacterium]
MKKDKDTEANRRAARRKFTKAATAALVAAPFVSAASAANSARAQTAAPKEPKAPPNPQPTPAPAASQQQQKPSPLATAYAEVARVRFGEQTTAEELERVARDLEGNVRTAERLRAFKLQNSDEPDFVFAA